MKVVWTEQALERLAAIEDFLAADSPAAAEALIRRLVSRAESLGESPRLGRRLPEGPR